MARILVKTKDPKEVQDLRKHGKIIFLSSLVDVVGIETTEAEVEKIKGLVGEDRVRESARGTVQKD
ncbi:hypothetical protein HKBW3S42_00458 [Candidatus Hakubella thermalkaliphila]|uniref:Uncharacterized protein n=1 Tax=Candidatus Hakubella thermalkaliphila TaxID=2754717 RepID=A0A6V8PT09_9ACTN|nr:hypothetical protein [Candidatus Hakubella thermalkaliphila]MBT9170796.1 hypothetical protein [Actinomycetota bacterium]GFP21705.1 hypothetical protein HKBW3S06_00932 [Candidatus Hakubella thermalkaliphila]GFP24675.1 hypothetical protein HKBW3S25_00112 [Candidatus Hakubella thermalkaliphila]GFP32153.1 hypothetical protein HKBW3S42_00458 [Candidatus Hakubella thermalkaliphila]GFP35437.1 hypothetical protein HKBW3S43_01228 [Candidatus Hakubella thermalkaliphila]